MPQMKMNRNWVVATKRGHTVRFEKGVPVGVPDDTTVVEACLAAGAEYVNPNQAPVLPDMSQPVAPAALTAAQRRDKVFVVFREMVANQAQHRDNFTAYGRRARSTSRLLLVSMSRPRTSRRTGQRFSRSSEVAA